MTNQETLTDKLVREAVEQFKEKFIIEEFSSVDEWELVIKFIETQIRQAIKEVKERLTLNKQCFRLEISQKRAERDYGFKMVGYNIDAEDLEDLKKTI